MLPSMSIVNTLPSFKYFRAYDLSVKIGSSRNATLSIPIKR